jgi:hypothetical protein
MKAIMKHMNGDISIRLTPVQAAQMAACLGSTYDTYLGFVYEACSELVGGHTYDDTTDSYYYGGWTFEKGHWTKEEPAK